VTPAADKRSRRRRQHTETGSRAAGSDPEERSTCVSTQSLTEKILAEEIHFGPAFDFDVAKDFRHAGETHRVFMSNEGEAGDRVGGNRDGRFELELLAHRHLVGVFHPLGNEHAAGAAHAQSLAIEEPIQRRSVAVHAAVQIDAGFDRLGSQHRPFGNVNLFIFLDEFDSRHRQHLHGKKDGKNQDHFARVAIGLRKIYSELCGIGWWAGEAGRVEQAARLLDCAIVRGFGRRRACPGVGLRRAA
jgi:hypothetical protein